MSNKYLFHQPAQRTFLDSVLLLIGHFAGSSLLFVVVFFFGWAISWLLHFLDSVHRFAPPIMEVIARIEVLLVYFDASLFALVVLIGTFRFIKYLTKESS